MNFKRQLARIFRYTLVKAFKRGGFITISPSFKCNYACKYCLLKINGKMPDNKTLDLSEWKRFLSDYNSVHKLREVILSGGEPTMLPYFTELCHWILFVKKWHLRIYTNFSDYTLLKVKPSTRLRIHASFHMGIDPVEYTRRYKRINKVHKVEVDELTTHASKKVLPYSKVKIIRYDQRMEKMPSGIRVSPDQSIHLSCHGVYKDFINTPMR